MQLFFQQFGVCLRRITNFINYSEMLGNGRVKNPRKVVPAFRAELSTQLRLNLWTSLANFFDDDSFLARGERAILMERSHCQMAPCKPPANAYKLCNPNRAAYRLRQGRKR